MPAVQSTADIALDTAQRLRDALHAAHADGVVTEDEHQQVWRLLALLLVLLCRLNTQSAAAVHVWRTGRLPRDYDPA